jgi:quercetin dioxygenase-like cupin family protein
MAEKIHLVRKDEGADVWPWQVKAAAEHTRGLFDFMVGEIDYHTGPPLHSHRSQFDSFYVLSGTLTVQAEGETVDLGPGDFVTIPPGVEHTFDNIYPDQPPVRVVNIMTAGGYDKALVEFNALGDKVFDLTEANKVGERYGVDITGPPMKDQPGPQK